jgi:hypothetical protein
MATEMWIRILGLINTVAALICHWWVSNMGTIYKTLFIIETALILLLSCHDREVSKCILSDLKSPTVIYVITYLQMWTINLMCYIMSSIAITWLLSIQKCNTDCLLPHHSMLNSDLFQTWGPANIFKQSVGNFPQVLQEHTTNIPQVIWDMEISLSFHHSQSHLHIGWCCIISAIRTVAYSTIRINHTFNIKE